MSEQAIKSVLIKIPQLRRLRNTVRERHGREQDCPAWPEGSSSAVALEHLDWDLVLREELIGTAAVRERAPHPGDSVQPQPPPRPPPLHDPPQPPPHDLQHQRRSPHHSQLHEPRPRQRTGQRRVYHQTGRAQAPSTVGTEADGDARQRRTSRAQTEHKETLHSALALCVTKTISYGSNPYRRPHAMPFPQTVTQWTCHAPLQGETHLPGPAPRLAALHEVFWIEHA